MPLLVVAAGGTGGHMFPAQSLAEEMLRRGWRVALSTDERGARYADGFPAEVTRRPVAAATFARGGVLAKLAAPFRIAVGVLSALAWLRREKPACVVGFGGYPTVPAMAAATLLGLPRMIHEANGVLGRVNQLFASRAHRVACGVWPTELPNAAEGVHTGNPVRDIVRAALDQPYAPPLKGPVRLCVFGGSQGASILSTTIPPAIALLPDDLRARLSITQQARPADAAEVAEAYAAMAVQAEIEPFFGDAPARMAAAHLIISRAGASSVADIAAIGRPSILIPLAIAIRDEQTANGRALVAAGAARMIAEKDLTPEGLAGHLRDLITTPNVLTEMAEAAREQGRPDAAERLADLVEKLAEAHGRSR